VRFPPATRRGLDWRRPRERSWLLFVTAVVLAVLAVVVARWRGPSWALAAVAVLAAVAGVGQRWLQERAKAQDRQQQLLAQFAITKGDRGERLPLVGEFDDPALRVHRAQVSVPYLRRDAEQELVAALQARDPVLVIGPSMAGKTRMAAEVLRLRYGDWPMLVPQGKKALGGLLAGGALLAGTGGVAGRPRPLHRGGRRLQPPVALPVQAGRQPCGGHHPGVRLRAVPARRWPAAAAVGCAHRVSAGAAAGQ